MPPSEAWLPWEDDPRVMVRGLAPRAAHLSIAPLYRLDAHVESSFHLLIVEQGTLVQRVGRAALVLAAGSVRLSAPGERQQATYGEHGARCLSIHLDPESCPEDLARIEVRSSLAWRRWARAVMAPALAGHAIDRWAVEMSLASLRAEQHGRPERRAPWLEDVRDQLAANLRHPPGLAALAGHAGRSRSQVARAFKDAFGCTPGQFVRRRRAEAAVALIRGGASLTDAALDAGFADQAHMHRIIVAHTGKTPGALARA